MTTSSWGATRLAVTIYWIVAALLLVSELVTMVAILRAGNEVTAPDCTCLTYSVVIR